jgi:hypothetical protein
MSCGSKRNPVGAYNIKQKKCTRKVEEKSHGGGEGIGMKAEKAKILY